MNKIMNFIYAKEKLRVRENLIQEIIEALTLPGEEFSDGECLDQIWQTLERYGYNINGEKEYGDVD